MYIFSDFNIIIFIEYFLLIIYQIREIIYFCQFNAFKYMYIMYCYFCILLSLEGSCEKKKNLLFSIYKISMLIRC